MSEIKTSAKGIDYAEPFVLKTKSRVYSQAMLMSIPHNSDKTDISLKLGRYTMPFGNVETQKPKSELTLDNDELNSLLSYISDNYTPINLGSGKYICVSENDEELINKFKELVEKNSDTAELLIEKGILSDNVFIAATSIKKKEALIDFEKNLGEALHESFWQDWFSENKWVLGSDFAQIIDERNIDTENIADYIMRAFDGFVDLVEIKKPNGLQFWSATKDHNNYVPSTDLVKAITQCLTIFMLLSVKQIVLNSLKRQKVK